MQLSLHADYALRLLIYLGTHPGETISTLRVSEAYGISKHHLVRVVHTMHAGGYVSVTPGRTGGVILARRVEEIRLGAVIRHAEPNLRLVECFDRATNTCPIAPVCRLKTLLNDAMEAFLTELDRYTLADLLEGPRRGELLEQLERIRPAPRAG